MTKPGERPLSTQHKTQKHLFNTLRKELQREIDIEGDVRLYFSIYYPKLVPTFWVEGVLAALKVQKLL